MPNSTLGCAVVVAVARGPGSRREGSQHSSTRLSSDSHLPQVARQSRCIATPAYIFANTISLCSISTTVTDCSRSVTTLSWCRLPRAFAAPSQFRHKTRSIVPHAAFTPILSPVLAFFLARGLQRCLSCLTVRVWCQGEAGKSDAVHCCSLSLLRPADVDVSMTSLLFGLLAWPSQRPRCSPRRPPSLPFPLSHETDQGHTKQQHQQGETGSVLLSSSSSSSSSLCDSPVYAGMAAVAARCRPLPVTPS